MISKEMTILEVLEVCPAAREVLIKHGMGCAVCFGAADESIESGAAMHGIDLALLLAELNVVTPQTDDHK